MKKNTIKVRRKATFQAVITQLSTFLKVSVPVVWNNAINLSLDCLSKPADSIMHKVNCHGRECFKLKKIKLRNPVNISTYCGFFSKCYSQVNFIWLVIMYGKLNVTSTVCEFAQFIPYFEGKKGF